MPFYSCALFSAMRHGRASASWGILANIARRLDSMHLRYEPNKRQLRHYPTLLQLDAKLNLGRSLPEFRQQSGCRRPEPPWAPNEQYRPAPFAWLFEQWTPRGRQIPNRL